jgi:hypothetical protein
MDLIQYSETCFEALKVWLMDLFVLTGFPRAFVESAIPFIPIQALDGIHVANVKMRILSECMNDESRKELMIEREAMERFKWWKGAPIRLATKELITVWSIAEALERVPLVSRRVSESDFCPESSLRCRCCAGNEASNVAATNAKSDSDFPIGDASSREPESTTGLTSTSSSQSTSMHLQSKQASSFRVTISSVDNIKEIGLVLIGRVEQGVVWRGDEVSILLLHSPALPCQGHVHTMEARRKGIECGKAGMDVAFHIRGMRPHFFLFCFVWFLVLFSCLFVVG